MSKKILSVILVLCMALSAVAVFSSCTGEGNPDESKKPVEYVDPFAGIEEYDELSGKVYEAVLGDFIKAYEAAKAEANESKKWALMAIAEAKLMESGVMMPTSSNGGNYALTRVAPNTATSTLWGNDSYRYHDVIVATELIKASDRAAMKAKWAELKGTGNYEAWVETYLTEKGYTIKDTYTITYNSDPQTWDVLATSRAADSEAIVNTYDGLYEYDMENRLMPALATDCQVSEDGKTYTFTIRPNVKWVDSQGREIGTVTAHDFVAGMQHMMDAAGGLEYLVQGIIVNATE
jgi:ABC-type transport system substrate-binding protein